MFLICLNSSQFTFIPDSPYLIPNFTLFGKWVLLGVLLRWGTPWGILLGGSLFWRGGLLILCIDLVQLSWQHTEMISLIRWAQLVRSPSENLMGLCRPPAPHTLLSHDAASGRSTYRGWNWRRRWRRRRRRRGKRRRRRSLSSLWLAPLWGQCGRVKLCLCLCIAVCNFQVEQNCAI